MNIKPSASNEEWNLIKDNWLIGLANKFSYLFIGLSFIIIAVFWTRLPPAVPLWFSRPWGTEQLAHPVFFLTFPIGSLLMYSINYLIAKYLTHEYLIFSQVLFLTSFFFCTISFFTLMKILFLIL